MHDYLAWQPAIPVVQRLCMTLYLSIALVVLLCTRTFAMHSYFCNSELFSCGYLLGRHEGKFGVSMDPALHYEGAFPYKLETAHRLACAAKGLQAPSFYRSLFFQSADWKV